MSKIEQLPDSPNEIFKKQLEDLKKEIQDVKKENSNLKKEIEPKKKMEEYVGPRQYSYKIWTSYNKDKIPEDKIVVDYVGFKKNKNLDAVYKNQFWQWEENQYMRLFFHDDTTEDIRIVDFKGYRNSEKQFIVWTRNKKGADQKDSVFYVFNVNEKEIAVNEKIIN